MKKCHLLSVDGFALCGRKGYNLVIHPYPVQVTCKHCLSIYQKMMDRFHALIQ